MAWIDPQLCCNEDLEAALLDWESAWVSRMRSLGYVVSGPGSYLPQARALPGAVRHSHRGGQEL